MKRDEERTTMRDERERELALAVLADEIRTRMTTPRSAFIDTTAAFAPARAAIARGRP